MTASRRRYMLMVDTETGVRAMVDAIEGKGSRQVVPRWPWAPLTQVMRLLPPKYTKRFA